MLNGTRLLLTVSMIAGAAMAGLPGTATATDTGTYSQSVGVADLDLASPQGEATLRHRIVLAARAVCGARDARDLASSAETAACRAEAIHEALRTAARIASVTAHRPASVADATHRVPLQG